MLVVDLDRFFRGFSFLPTLNLFHDRILDIDEVESNFLCFDQFLEAQTMSIGVIEPRGFRPDPLEFPEREAFEEFFDGCLLQGPKLGINDSLLFQ